MTKLSKQEEKRLAETSGFKKTCTRCNRYKPFSEYHNDRAASDGKCTMCKPCRLKSVASSRAKRKGKRNFVTAFDTAKALAEFKMNLVAELNKSHQHTREYVDNSVRLEKLRREESIKTVKESIISPWLVFFTAGLGSSMGILLTKLVIYIF